MLPCAIKHSDQDQDPDRYVMADSDLDPGRVNRTSEAKDLPLQELNVSHAS